MWFFIDLLVISIISIWGLRNREGNELWQRRVQATIIPSLVSFFTSHSWISVTGLNWSIVTGLDQILVRISIVFPAAHHEETSSTHNYWQQNHSTSQYTQGMNYHYHLAYLHCTVLKLIINNVQLIIIVLFLRF